MKLNKIIFNSTILLVSLYFYGCAKEEERTVQNFRNVILTEVESVGQTASHNYSGVVEEGKSVNAAFMTGGKIVSLNVKEGDRVRKGQLIATLDDEDYKIGVNQLQVQYDQMVSEKERMDEMYARHNIAPNDYEKFEAGFQQLKLQLDLAHNKLAYTKLYSPSDGFISFKYMQPGELVDAGTPIYKVTDDTNLEVSVDLPLQVYLNKNSIQDAYGIVPNLSTPIPLKIESFSPDADNNQLYHMKLSIPANLKKELTTGMNMKVNIEMNNETSGEALIPSRSIFDENGISYVWLVNDQDSTLSKRKVIVMGQPQGNKSMVTGLNGSEKIVSAGVKQLKEGEKVNIISNPVAQ